jgi:hypothetical protein
MVKQNLTFCLKKIGSAAQKACVDAHQIVLVAITKGVALPLIQEAIESGIEHIGENRIQEALLKYKWLQEYAKGKGVKLFWHMVGHLQRNKVKEAVELFDLIHSVDSAVLAVEIDKQACRVGKIQDVLLQVNVSREASKYGFNIEAVGDSLREITTLKNINVIGLMTIAPLVADAEEVRKYFRQLKQLEGKINELRISNLELRILSMGMTNDFEVAVEEGATMVRIGRGIFERTDCG